MNIEEEVLRFWNENALEYRIGRLNELGILRKCAAHFTMVVIKDFEESLDKWLIHAGRGEKAGNPAYFVGRISLICSLQDELEKLKKQADSINNLYDYTSDAITN